MRAAFDPTALARMLDNLFANAVRFSPAGEAVIARCAEAHGAATIAVEDGGPGVAEDQRPSLFYKFRQGVAVLGARIGVTVQYRPRDPRG